MNRTNLLHTHLLKVLFIGGLVLFPIAVYLFSRSIYTPLPERASTAGKHETITILAKGTKLPNERLNAIQQQLSDRIGMSVALETVTYDVSNNISRKVDSGDPPDIVGVDKQTWISLIKHNVLMPLDPYLDSLDKVRSSMSIQDFSNGYYKGKLYGIPKRREMNTRSLWIRKDWLDNLGITLKPNENVYDFVKIAKAFTDSDPDRNGFNDTFGYTSTFSEADSVFEPLFGAFELTGGSNLVQKGKEIIFEPIDPRFRIALNLIIDFIGSHAVDEQFLTNSPRAAMDKALNGKAGILYTDMLELVGSDFFQRSKEYNPKAEWIPMSALATPFGSYSGYEDDTAAPLYYGVLRHVAANTKKVDRIMQLFNDVSADSGYDLVAYGLEGKDFTVKNGEVEMIREDFSSFYIHNYQLTGRNDPDYLYTRYPDHKNTWELLRSIPRLKILNGSIFDPDAYKKDRLDPYIHQQMILFMSGKRSMNQYGDFINELYTQYDLARFLQLVNATQYSPFEGPES